MSHPRGKHKFKTEQHRPDRVPTVDLDKPEDARFFLRGVKIKGKHITFVQLADGRQLDIDQMTDGEAVAYAKDIYIDFLGGVEGKRGIIELDPKGRTQ